MSKEITKAKILQELEDKFKLRELEPERFSFSEMVVPVYDVGPHLTKTQVMEETVSISSGPTEYTFFIIPWNERWFIHTYNVIFMTGTYTVAGLMVTRRVVANYIYIDLKAAQNVSYAVNLPKDVIGNPGDIIRVYVDGYTITGDLMLRLDATVEEVR